MNQYDLKNSLLLALWKFAPIITQHGTPDIITIFEDCIDTLNAMPPQNVVSREEYDAQVFSGQEWERDAIQIAKSLGIDVTDHCDGWLDQCLERIKAMQAALQGSLRLTQEISPGEHQRIIENIITSLAESGINPS